MDGTEKVIIALGFFTLIGFLAYCVFASTQGSVATLGSDKYVTVAELKGMRNGR